GSWPFNTWQRAMFPARHGSSRYGTFAARKSAALSGLCYRRRPAPSAGRKHRLHTSQAAPGRPHQPRKAPHPANADVSNWPPGVAARYAQAWGDATVAPTASLKKLWLITYREAQVQAFGDAYLVIALCFTLSLAMVPLLRQVTVADRPPRAMDRADGRS